MDESDTCHATVTATQRTQCIRSEHGQQLGLTDPACGAVAMAASTSTLGFDDITQRERRCTYTLQQTDLRVAYNVIATIAL